MKVKKQKDLRVIFILENRQWFSKKKKAEKGKSGNWKDSLSEKNWPFLGAPSPLKYTRLFRGQSVAEAEAKKFLGILESSKSRKSEKKISVLD